METSRNTSEPGTGNAAVDRCLAAYTEALNKRKLAGGHEGYWKMAGNEAYKRAMPPVSGIQNVADYIACVTRGFIEDVILSSEVNQYLYAAQVANTVKSLITPAAPKRPRGRPSTSQAASEETNCGDNSSVNTPSEN